MRYPKRTMRVWRVTAATFAFLGLVCCSILFARRPPFLKNMKKQIYIQTCRVIDIISWVAIIAIAYAVALGIDCMILHLIANK